MKTKEVISTVKKCIKKIECSNYDMANMSMDLLSVRRFLYGLGMNDLGDEVKDVNKKLGKSNISRRSMVSRLETVIHELNKIDSVSCGRTRKSNKETNRSQRKVSRFDVILAPVGTGYSYCLVSEVVPNETVSVYPIVFAKEAGPVASGSKCYSLQGIEGTHSNAFLVGEAATVPYKTARNCFVEKYPSSRDLQKALDYLAAC